MTLTRLAVCSIGLIGLLAGCDPAAKDSACKAGETMACVGKGGCMGGQACKADGSGFGACECSDAPKDGGPTDDDGAIHDDKDSATSDVDAAMSVSDAGDPSDAADAAVDAGPTTCDPVAQTGCASDERCVWLQKTASKGALVCVPQGTVAKGGMCSAGLPGPDTGYDNCKRGLTCIANECAKICDSAEVSSCGSTDVCLLYEGIFANGGTQPTIGACQPACDPVTQQLKAGGTCGVGKGCYGQEQTFTCVPSTSVLVQGAVVSGTAYFNSCAPGFTAYKAPNGDWVCTAYCQPAVTHSGATAGAAGTAPYSCPDRGANAPYECRFGSVFSLDPSPSPAADTWGLCLDITGRTYDHDGDPSTDEIPWPSCKTLSSDDTNFDGLADNIEWGCAPRP